MKITIVDTRSLGVAIQRSDAKYWNPTTTGWETPFDAFKHVIPFTVVDPSNPLFASTIAADIGSVLLERQDCAALILQVDRKTGAPTAVVDVWTLPSPVPNPTVGGFRA
jgi:hypothetical protein